MTDIVLAARLDPAWNRAEVDLANATETDLRYRSLLGDVEFRIGDADFSAQRGWIPLLDFAIGLTGLLALYGKIHRQRLDHAHRTALTLVRDHNLIVQENLNITNMTRRPKPRPDGSGGREPNGATAKSGNLKAAPSKERRSHPGAPGPCGRLG
jgi:hypothetical protein